MIKNNAARKKIKTMPSPQDIKTSLFNTEEPFLLKNILSWDVLNWTLDAWVSNLGNPNISVRVGGKQCSKVPQWENNCKMLSISLKDLLIDTTGKSANTWMYFDYKYMKNCFKDNSELLKSLSWADFGFPEKNGKDSTIWIGTQGAYTSCHMDSYGSNIVAQVYGRKLWILFPPSKMRVLKPSRIPYEESSIYSQINFSCGLNVEHEVGDAQMVELEPGDVLVVPKHWWHFVENLTTSISVNMWIPLESDHVSRLEESLVRFFVASTIKTLNLEGGIHLLNPNEIDLLDETVDLQQIVGCLKQVLSQDVQNENIRSAFATSHNGFVLPIPYMTAESLQKYLLKKCGCVKECGEHSSKQPMSPFSAEHVINAFCHPDVIAKITEVLVSMRNA